MARAAAQKIQFVCQNCGVSSNRWQGRCEDCGEWNSFVEETASSGVGAGPAVRTIGRGRVVALTSLTGANDEAPRTRSGIAEFDRVTGGGFVRGSTLLVGGDPGIGKSTLLLQVAGALANVGESVVYISGEEAAAQIRLRADRLDLSGAPVKLAAETSVENVLATLSAEKPPALLIIDSIQTLWTDIVDSAPGTVTQVRSSAQALIRYAKQSGTAVVFVGHVTKDGQIAGPRVVEHMVDAVLYFEGEGGHHFRILRAVKNRFGPTDEIGVFEMTGAGLTEVANPSELFLGERNANTPGAAVFAGMEGTRPLLVEIQALVAPTPLGTPRRAVIGWILPASPWCWRFWRRIAAFVLAIAMSISTSPAACASTNRLPIWRSPPRWCRHGSTVALPSDTVYFGEVSLSGAVRPVGHAPARLREAQKLGFARAVIPAGKESEPGAAAIMQLADLVATIAARARSHED